jgi:hypothetical protein
MYRSPSSAIPDEYRLIAENLFPSGGPPSSKKGLKAAGEYANALGIGTEYKRLLDKVSGAELSGFLGQFQNNLDLLIQKTWVEKADEARKEKLQDDVPGFVSGIVHGKFQQALVEFGAILEELAYLFFGTQSTKEDFSEYTFRIDAQIGLFWWYGSQLGCLKEMYKDGVPDNESLWAVLLIGICYLTNF